ncbi:MAG: magnesium chelatase ATPase subunit I [Gammaproteobacteria bacterium]
MSAFPFSAIVGQEDMKRALLMSAIDPGIGGVLAFGDRGTGKSTAVRALADLLPKIRVVIGCPYGCEPDSGKCDCDACAAFDEKDKKASKLVPTPVVNLPLGVTEDRVVGALDLERALAHGEKAFEPGLLARANRGFLYIDEVNLLEDHVVDLLLDVAASGENLVEREGLSVRHPARFVLIGSGNPEEGELRPQLLDRFGLSVDISTPTDIKQRVEVIRRRGEFELDQVAFRKKWSRKEGLVRKQVNQGREHLPSVTVPDAVLEKAAELCVALKTDGLRGELTMIKTARALAALQGDDAVSVKHLRDIAKPSLGHRLRRAPLDDAGSGVRIERALDEVFGNA